VECGCGGWVCRQCKPGNDFDLWDRILSTLDSTGGVFRLKLERCVWYTESKFFWTSDDKMNLNKCFVYTWEQFWLVYEHTIKKTKLPPNRMNTMVFQPVSVSRDTMFSFNENIVHCGYSMVGLSKWLFLFEQIDTVIYNWKKLALLLELRGSAEKGLHLVDCWVWICWICQITR